MPFKIHVLREARPSASSVEDPHRSRDRLRRRASLGGYPRNTHVAQPSYSALSLEIGDFTVSVIRCCVRCPPSLFTSYGGHAGSLSGFPGSSFQPCTVPRRTKGFAFGVVKSKGLRGKSFRFGCHGVTRPTVSFDLLLHTIPNIQCIQCIPCIQWFNSPISTCSTRSTRLKSLTRNNSKLTFRLTAGYYASKTRLYQRSFIAHHDIADFPCPPSAEINQRTSIRFPSIILDGNLTDSIPFRLRSS